MLQMILHNVDLDMLSHVFCKMYIVYTFTSEIGQRLVDQLSLYINHCNRDLAVYHRVYISMQNNLILSI